MGRKHKRDPDLSVKTKKSKKTEDGKHKRDREVSVKKKRQHGTSSSSSSGSSDDDVRQPAIFDNVRVRTYSIEQ